MWYKNDIWCDSETDTDEDELPDYMELVLGTNINGTDSDSDGLPDGYEVLTLGTDPTLADSDSNNVSDAAEDADSDGLTNLSEYQLGTNPMAEDSDNDDLTDSAEVSTYYTDPTDEDTDGDGANDGWEVLHNTNPLVVNADFDVTISLGFRDDDVAPSVSVEDVTGEQAQSLTIEQETANSYYINDTVGAVGSAYNFSMTGEFDSAEISFEFDSDLLLDPDFDPVIYWFDEENQELVPLTTTVTGNAASAQVDHFSLYILVDQVLHENAYEWIGDFHKSVEYDSIEMVFVIDDRSVSSVVNPQTAAIELGESLPGGSKVGVVRVCGENPVALMTNDNDYYMAYSSSTSWLFSMMNTQIGSGQSNLYSAMTIGLDHFSNPVNSSISRVLVVFSDGDAGDANLKDYVINYANTLGVKIVTFSIGNNTDNIDNNLRVLSNDTMGICYPIESYENFCENYCDLVNLYFDYDTDGIPDDFELSLPLYNGNILSTNPTIADTDEDHLRDGEEIRVIFDYYAKYDAVRVITKYISDPTSSDTDCDGIEDDLDSDPLYLGLAGGIVGKLSIVSDSGNLENIGSSAEIDYGHSFLIYKSYISQYLDLSELLAGYVWDPNLETYSPSFNNSEYNIKPNSYISFGAWSNAGIIEGNGVMYNKELWNACCNHRLHSNNIALSDDIDMLQLSELLYYLNKNNEWKIDHNCSTVAVNAWNQVFDDDLSAKGKGLLSVNDTPTGLYNSILFRKNDSSNDIEMPMVLLNMFS